MIILVGNLQGVIRDFFNDWRMELQMLDYLMDGRTQHDAGVPPGCLSLNGGIASHAAVPIQPGVLGFHTDQ